MKGGKEKYGEYERSIGRGVDREVRRGEGKRSEGRGGERSEERG